MRLQRVHEVRQKFCTIPFLDLFKDLNFPYSHYCEVWVFALFFHILDCFSQYRPLEIKHTDNSGGESSGCPDFF